ncbi:hypothetical protein EV421DRAFT_1231602 [Armillaria borealis]|uniref:Uncharacterized protein n=1 Tax=Armillaria borealis TaxID=47425 RepID=A0AA39J3Q6_9AGAR|nr:hypothetical protein EV421DRAFT_1231602 [Armillaria borealis]
MVLGFVVPLPAWEVRPVFGFVVRVLAHVMPGYVLFLRRLLIGIAWCSEEGYRNHRSYSRVSRVGPSSGALGAIYSLSFRIASKRCSESKGVYRRRMALCDRYFASPGCYAFGDRYMIVLFTTSHPAHSANSPKPSPSASERFQCPWCRSTMWL